jgi:Polyketide cyclase / dehydrase and lipid transport
MPDRDASASSTVEIAASPAAVYALISDLTVLADLAEETTAMRWTAGSTAAAAGARFRGSNRNGWHRWTTTCVVTDAAAGQRFAFDVTHTGVPIARWQYDIAAVGAGCAVTESTWDRRPGWFRRFAKLGTGVGDRQRANGAHIEATLRRLKTRAEAG